MKIRNGFVSNSSSSSFVINKRYLTEDLIVRIYKHREKAGCWQWNIEEDEYCLYGDCAMDNFDMREYLEKIGVDINNVKWEHGG